MTPVLIGEYLLTRREEHAIISCVFKKWRLRDGEMSEWLKEPVLKTGGAQVPVGSNPTLSAIFSKVHQDLRKYPSGRRGSPAKGVGWIKPARGFKSLLPRQFRDPHRRSVPGSAGNCARVGISSRPAGTCLAGLTAEGTGMRREFPGRSVLTAYCRGGPGTAMVPGPPLLPPYFPIRLFDRRHGPRSGLRGPSE